MLYKLIFTENLNAAYGAQTFGPVIWMRAKYKDDAGLLEHEKTHVAQFWRTGGMHIIWTQTSAAYRLKTEVEAYKAQLKANPKDWPDYTEMYAGFLVKKYGLNITQDEAVKLLKA